MDEGTKNASQSAKCAKSHAPTALWLEHQLTSSAGILMEWPAFIALPLQNVKRKNSDLSSLDRYTK